jgi:DNA-binding NarL/FixJ family response regulator
MSYRVLVVDDTNFMRKMAGDCLKQHGYEVAGEAVNGREAVKLYDELRPDIVLMDLTMPEMNGIDAMEEILKMNSDAVVLICSASNQQSMIHEALASGAKGYLMKPFDPERLYDTIRTYAEPHLIAAHAIVLESSEQPSAEFADVPADIQAQAHEETYAETDAVKEVDHDIEEEAPVKQEEIAEQVNPLEKLGQGNERVRRFTSRHVCSWQEDFQGETANYSVTYTTHDNKVLIELTSPNQGKQTIPLPLDGFRLLSSWLEAHTRDHVGNI